MFHVTVIQLRFQTDANQGGVEKLTVSMPVSGMMQGRPGLAASSVTSVPDADQLVGPCGLLMVKGWTRSVALFRVLGHCYEEEEFLKAR